MKRIAVVVTSYSGKLKEEIEQEGMFFLPLQLEIDENQWLEGEYTNKEKYQIVENFKNSKKHNTSLPQLSLIVDQMKELSDSYDDVLYFTIDSHLSSTCSTLVNNAKDYNNVYVFDNHLCGSTIFRLAQEAKRRYENGQSIKQIMTYLDWFNNNSIGYIIPKDLNSFIKSGRLKGIKKVLLKSVNLSLIIEVGKLLKTAGIKRTSKSAVVNVINKIFEFMKKNNLNQSDVDFSIIWAFDKTITNTYVEYLNSIGITPNFEEESSIVTMMHTGVGAGYVGINPKIK